MPEFKAISFPSSTGKNIIHATICIPDGTPRGVVQIAHGISEHIARYEGFMTFLAENGFVVAGNDHLGHGLSASTPSDRGFFCETDGWTHAVNDMETLHGIMSGEYPGIPYIFFGHSMGSFLTRTYLIRYPANADLAIICGTGHQAAPVAVAGKAMAEAAVRIFGPRKPGEVLNKIAFGSYNERYGVPRTEFDWLSRDPEEVDKYIDDPLCGFIPTVSLFRDMMGGIGYIINPVNIAKMDKEMPVLFIAGHNDPVGEYGEGVKRAFRAFIAAGMRHVHIKLYPYARHELLNEVNKEEVMSDIMKWINSKLSG